jgi:hypothetical protein
MAEPAPQPELSTLERIQRMISQDRTPSDDVSHETSPEPEADAEPEVTAHESDSEPAAENAQLEGDEAEASEGIHTFAELAKSFEVDEETLAKHLRVTGRDGKEVALHDVLTAYRAPAPEAAEVERSRARLVELEGKEADVTRAAEELRRTAQSFAAQLRSQEPNWAELKARDPVAYATARMERIEQERQLEIAARQYQATKQHEHAEQQERLLAFRNAEAQKLQGARPEWSDRKAFETELVATEKFLVSSGYKPEEIAQVVDHRDWLVADKARRWDELQAKKPAVLKRLNQAPRLNPGASSGADRGVGARSAQAESAAAERLRASGRDDDAADLIMLRLQSSAKRAAGRALATGRRS